MVQWSGTYLKKYHEYARYLLEEEEQLSVLSQVQEDTELYSTELLSYIYNRCIVFSCKYFSWVCHPRNILTVEYFPNYGMCDLELFLNLVTNLYVIILFVLGVVVKIKRFPRNQPMLK